jgi:membrane protein DedA with SNARE-associated domain
MNALVLWIPGTSLIIIGALLLALGRLDLGVALAVIGIGIALETVGTLLWIRQRVPRDRPLTRVISKE